MKLEANLEIVNNLACKKGYRKNTSCFSNLTIGKDSNSNKYYLIVTSSKNPTGDKFKISQNVDKIFCKFVNEGKATLILKEPNFTLVIQKVSPIHCPLINTNNILI